MHLTQRLTAVGCGLVLVLALVPNAPADFHNIALPVELEEDLATIEPLLHPVTEVTSEIPENPQEALVTEVEALSQAVGFQQDAGDRIASAGLSDEVYGRLANVVTDMHTCALATTTHWEDLDPSADELLDIMRGDQQLTPEEYVDIQDCTEQLYVTSVELELTLAAAFPSLLDCPLAEIDVWPVLFFEGFCLASTYKNDYMLTVDLGGNDVYINNVGGNMIDLNFAPASSDVPGLRGFGDSEGCNRAIPGLLAADCTPLVGVLVDQRGNDKFGVKQEPAPLDQQCTEDPLVRRLVTVGSGFLGASILISSDNGNDKYTGKTGAVGTGHIFGVGLILDRGGNDKFLAIRNSIGFALVGGVGIVHSQGGNDDYDFYMPAVRSDGEFAGLDVIDDAEEITASSAALEEDETLLDPPPGNGGAVDDEDRCDNRLRFLMGAGNVGSGPTIGIIKSEDGDDSFRGGFSDDFRAPAQPDRGGSLGFGEGPEGATGNGVILNLGGDDTYEIVDQAGQQGLPERGDDTVILPGEDSTGPGGLFIDHE